MNLEEEKLNFSQKVAVEAPLGPTLVVAGAGTGKTTVLVHRFEYLVKEKNIQPEKITLVAFTNKAATQINSKLLLLFDKDKEISEKIGATTFHRFCKNILLTEGRKFRVCSHRVSKEFIKQIINRLGLSLRANYEMSKIIEKVRYYKHVEKKVITPEDLLRAAKNCTPYTEEEIKFKFPFEVFSNVLKEYEEDLKRNNFLALDDLIFEVDKLLDNESKRIYWEEKSQAILFDEFQDIDPVQLSIIFKLSKNRKNIFCVGDPDQAIYGFRNALPDSFLKFKALFPEAKVLKLEQNYRSTHEILKVANDLINKKKNDFSKNLVPFSRDNLGEKVELFITNNPAKEVEKIIETIMKIQKEKAISYRSFAVFFRKWAYEKELAQALYDKNIPFFSESLKNIWTKEEIKDCLAYLEVAFEKNIELANKSFLRIINKPSRGISGKYYERLKEEANRLKVTLLELVEKRATGDAKCERVWKIISKIKSLAQKKENFQLQIQRILNYSGLLDYYARVDSWRLTNIHIFFKFIIDMEIGSIEEVLPKVKELNKFTNDKDAVYLSTVHSAKGSEFDYVFVMHMEEGKLPYSLALGDENKVDEERRIAYVAFTRAKNRLFLSCSGGERNISSFLKDIEHHFEKTVKTTKDYEKLIDEDEEYLCLEEDMFEEVDEDE